MINALYIKKEVIFFREITSLSSFSFLVISFKMTYNYQIVTSFGNTPLKLGIERPMEAPI